MIRATPCIVILAGVAVVSASGANAQTAPDSAAQGPWTLHEALKLPENVRIEGHIRPRYEALSNPFVAGRTEDDEFLGLQTQLRAEIDFGQLTFGGELLDSRFISGNETGGAPSEIDTLEPAQLYMSWRPENFLADGANLDLTLGRFTADIGARRLVARANYRSILASFDGARAVWTSAEDLKFTLMHVAPVAREPSDAASAIDNEVSFNQTQDNVRFSVVHLDAPLPADLRGELYAFDFQEDDDSEAATRNRDLLTVGARLHKAPESGQFDFDAEYAHQTGSQRATTSPADLVALDHEAGMLHAEVGFSFDAPWSPRLALHYDHVSGDSSPTDNQSERFDSLFGDRSFELGPTSIYGLIARNNLASPGIRIEVKPDPASDAYIMVRHIALDAPRDSFANTSVRDATGASGDEVGVQIEGRYRHWLVKDSLRLSLGAATLFQGDFMETAPNATGQGDPVYGFTELTWSF